MGRAAGLQQKVAGGRRAKKVHLAVSQALAFADTSGPVRDGNLENRLGQIHRDSRMLLQGLLLSRVTL